MCFDSVATLVQGWRTGLKANENGGIARAEIALPGPIRLPPRHCNTEYTSMGGDGMWILLHMRLLEEAILGGQQQPNSQPLPSPRAHPPPTLSAWHWKYIRG